MEEIPRGTGSITLGKLMLFGIAVAFFAAAASAYPSLEQMCGEAVPHGHYPRYGVGTATMLTDGTICVLLKPFVDPESGVELDEKPAPMLVVFTPDRPSYSFAQKEIGILRPGQTKVIRRLNTYPDQK
jgi:hypothetical protein